MIAAAVTVILVELLVAAVLAILLLWWRGQVREEVRDHQEYIDGCAADIERQRDQVATERQILQADQAAFDRLVAANTERLALDRRSLVSQRNLINTLERAETTLRRAGLGPDPRHSVRDAALRLASDSDPTPPAGTTRPSQTKTVIGRPPPPEATALTTDSVLHLVTGEPATTEEQ